MENKSETYRADIFGFGNGTLHIAVMPSPDNWEAGRDLNVCLSDGDLEPISLEIFRIATGKPYTGDDNIMKLRNDDRQLFARIAPEFPMLSRINYIFEDVFFNVEEVEQLRNECVKLQSITKDSAADLGLRKLLYSCEEALKDNFGVELTCD
jgi:hypothetical protein